MVIYKLVYRFEVSKGINEIVKILWNKEGVRLIEKDKSK